MSQCSATKPEQVVVLRKTNPHSVSLYVTKTFTYDNHRYKVRGKTEEEAILKKAQLLADLKAGKPVRQNAKARKLSKLTTNISVEDYAEVWLRILLPLPTKLT